MAADETTLGDLHTKVANVLTDLLDGRNLPTGEFDDAGNEIMHHSPPSAAIITAATQFLKNNNITCQPSEDNALGALRDKLKQREANRANKADLKTGSTDARFMTGLPN